MSKTTNSIRQQIKQQQLTTQIINANADKLVKTKTFYSTLSDQEFNISSN